MVMGTWDHKRVWFLALAGTAFERMGQRDHEVEQMRAGKRAAAYREPAQVVAVHVDAGKIRLRGEDGRPGAC